MRRRPGLIVDIRALIVVERHGENEIRIRHEFAQRMPQPARGINASMRRVAHPFCRGVVAMRVLQRRGRRIAAFEHVVQRHPVRGALQEPGRITAVAPFVANHRTRPHDHVKAEFAPELQHAPQVATRVRVAIEVERAVRRFMPIPRHVQIERVGARAFHGQHRIAPALGRNAFIKEGTAEEEERLAVDEQLRRSIALHDSRMRERGPPAREPAQAERVQARARPQARTATSARCGRGSGRRPHPRAVPRRRSPLRTHPSSRTRTAMRTTRRGQAADRAGAGTALVRRCGATPGPRWYRRHLARARCRRLSTLITVSSGTSVAGSASNPRTSSATFGKRA